MNQTTNYLDEEIENRMKTAVKKGDLSTSKKIATEWPQEVVELAGSWGDNFPSLQEIRSTKTNNKCNYTGVIPAKAGIHLL